MSKKAQDFVQQVNKQNFSAAKGLFESAMAEKILAVFENKKIELASHMAEGTQITESQMVEGRNKPDLQRDIGYWAIEKDTGQIYSGPHEKRKDAKDSAVHLVRGGKRTTPNIVVKFGTVDRTGKFKEL